MISTNSCKEDEISPGTTGTMEVLNSEVRAYTIVSVLFTDVLLDNETYEGTIGGEKISGQRVNSQTVAFIVPENVKDGDAQVILNIAGDSYSNQIEILPKIQVNDPKSEYTNLYEELTTDTFFNGIDIAALNEAMAEFEALTPEEQIEAARFLATNRSALDALTKEIRKTELETDFSFNKMKRPSEKTKVIVAGVAYLLGAVISSGPLMAIGATYIIAKTIQKAVSILKPYANKLYDKILKGLDYAFGVVAFGNMSKHYEFIMDEAEKKIFNKTQSLPDTIYFKNGDELKFSLKLYYEPFVSEKNSGDFPMVKNLLDGYLKLKKIVGDDIILPSPTINEVKKYAEDIDQYSISVSNTKVKTSDITGTPELAKVSFSTDEISDQPFSFTLSYTNEEGETSTFTQKAELKAFRCPATVTDPDGNIYPVVQIGNQCWFAENLRYTGNISQASDTVAWAYASPAWCYYNNDPANDAIYGKLYNWYAVETGSLCPPGWHIPTNKEWTVLTEFLGGVREAGGKMKDTTGWNAPNTGATNSSGFSGLPGGKRFTKGEFKSVGINGYWWSSTQYDLLTAWDCYLYYNYDIAARGKTSKGIGLSCRCVKD